MKPGFPLPREIRNPKGKWKQNKSTERANSLLVYEDAKEGERGAGLNKAFLSEHQPRETVAETAPRFADGKMICNIGSNAFFPRKTEGAGCSADDL